MLLSAKVNNESTRHFELCPSSVNVTRPKQKSLNVMLLLGSYLSLTNNFDKCIMGV